MLTESFDSEYREESQRDNSKGPWHTRPRAPTEPVLEIEFQEELDPTKLPSRQRDPHFAAQAGKSVIHVYSRERHNQEAVVPFQEQTTCLARAGKYDGTGALVAGTQGGRLIVWELATGRQISTPQSHLQSVTCVAVDPTSNFIISGSSDSNLHVWSIASLLSFSPPAQNDPSQSPSLSPIRTLTNHRAGITSVIFGQSASKANFAISASKDQTCIVWDYRNGTMLHTYLMSGNPLCLALDPADRAAYVAYEDGSIQFLDFYRQSSTVNPLYDSDQQSAPMQPPPSDRWQMNDDLSSTLSLQVSYDGTTLLSGHENGKIHTWNIARGRYGSQLADLSLPVTNLIMLPPTGFPNQRPANIKMHNVVKPRYETSLDSSHGSSIMPSNYTFTSQFTSALPLPDPPAHYHDLDQALTHPSFPSYMLDEGIAELTASSSNNSSSEYRNLEQTNGSLKAQLDDALRRQKEAIAKVLQLEERTFQREEDEAVKRARKKRRRIRGMQMEERRRKVVMGEIVDPGEGDGDVEMDEEDGEDLSSDSDEMSSG